MQAMPFYHASSRLWIAHLNVPSFSTYEGYLLFDYSARAI